MVLHMCVAKPLKIPSVIPFPLSSLSLSMVKTSLSSFKRTTKNSLTPITCVASAESVVM